MLQPEQAAGCDSLIEQAPDIDILVNNVGLFEPMPFEKITDADWLRFFETNVLSGVRLSRHYRPACARGTGDGSSLFRVNRPFRFPPK